jgi:fumarate reductase flavoprotein subunit
VTRYNGYVTTGEDEDFGRPDLDYKLENPPFYAIRTGVLVIASCGGPRNNVRQQVLDRNDKVIPGLYVAGEVSGYQGFATGMYTMGNLVFGKQAGRIAAWVALGSRS